MPILILNSARPPVAIANKSPVQHVPQQNPPTDANTEMLAEILGKLKSIEAELGINSQPQVSEEEELARKLFAEKMKVARAMKKAEREQAEIEAEQKKKEFVKRMAKAKRKAAKARERGD